MENCELKSTYCNNKYVKLIRRKSEHNIFDGDLRYWCEECRKLQNGQFKLINNMTETKEKVNVADIMQRAKEKTAAVKASTVKAQNKVDTFKIVPGFTKYEFNGNILRNVATKNIIKFKSGRNKYQIFNDVGVSHNLSNEDLRLSLKTVGDNPKEPKLKKEKVVKVKAVKVPKVKISKVEILPNMASEIDKVADLSKKDIITGEYKDNKKHYMLHLKGLSALEIHEATKKPLPSIKRDIWRYMNGKTVL